ncbi:MAG: hypothetical protein ACP5M0_12745, partial [Desulfomonilaceae bacterium]
LICHAGLDPASSELTWIPTSVGMTCSGTTAQFSIIFENGYIGVHAPRQSRSFDCRNSPRQIISRLGLSYHVME